MDHKFKFELIDLDDLYRFAVELGEVIFSLTQGRKALYKKRAVQLSRVGGSGGDARTRAATMNASDADRQIKQMVNFILQEAQEKANEIRIKVSVGTS